MITKKPTSRLYWILLLLYLLLLLFIVFFTPNRYRDYMQQYHLHVIPLETTLDGLKGPRGQHFWPYWIEYFGNLLGNVILFVPMGYLLKALRPGRPGWTIVVTGLCISLGIEVVQLLFKIGVCDVDDVLLNTLGTGCGVWLFGWRNQSLVNRKE